MRQKLEVARELLLGSTDESATVNPKQEWERRGRRRGAVDVQQHVGLVAVALVEERDDITGRVPTKHLGGSSGRRPRTPGAPAAQPAAG